MDKTLIKDFTVRITQASRSELLVIMYEVILEDINSAKKDLAEGKKKEFERGLKHGCRFLNELMATLDYTIPISHELLSLYSYTNKVLIRSMVSYKEEPLSDAIMIIERLHNAFVEISKQDMSGPVMKNVQHLYAGLTYGKGVLNESFLDPDQSNRGYRV